MPNCENIFWDLHTIVIIHNDTACGFHLTLPFPCSSDTLACELPGYGNINPADPDASSLLVYFQKATFVVFSQTRSYHPSQYGLRPDGNRDDPVRPFGDRRRIRRSSWCSEGVGARSIHRRDRESQTRRYLRE